MLKLDSVIRTDVESRNTEVQRRGEVVQFESFKLQWRTMPSKKNRIKKGIFVFSVSAAIGYYLFLGILALIR